MCAFPIIPAGNISISLRKLICGVGVNDADYAVSPRINGKKIICPFYQRWHSMLTRCYDQGYQFRNPSYNGCSVCPEWLVFSCFKEWMEAQSWEGMQLDKDLLVKDNKIYSPETCCFVSRKVNSLFTNCRGKGENFPTGVSFVKDRGVYQAHCNNGSGKVIYLGLFNTIDLARLAYQDFKSKLIIETANNPDERLSDRAREALISRAFPGSLCA